MNKIILMLIFLLMPVLTFGADRPTKSDIFWLTQNIYWESRCQPTLGKLMVGIVTLNRLESKRWGNTVKEVVTANKQFSWFSDGKSDIPKNKNEWKKSREIALSSYILCNAIDIDKIMYYHSTSVNPFWSKHKIKVITIGNHIFYRDK